MINFCPYCGAKTSKGAKFCTQCGAPIAEFNKPIEPQDASEQAPAENVVDGSSAHKVIIEQSAQSQGTTQSSPSQNSTQSAPNYAPQGASSPVYRAVPVQEPKRVDNTNSIMSLVFGGMCPFFAIFSMFPFVGILFIALTITFIVLAKKKRNAHVREAGRDNGFSRAGNINAVVAIPLLALFSIYYLSFTIAILATVA